ncbi:MAG: DsbA family oxidoreductase [Bacillota bacterium]|nr:DsbA family oxidoreductase [Bacillota bacterium]
MKITYWSDYACPFCYIGEKRMEKAIAELPQLGEVQLEMKSFELDPSAPDCIEGSSIELLAQKYGMPPEEAARQVERITQMGQADGLDMNYESVRLGNTLDAHRLTKLAQSKGDPDLANRLIEELFQAYFSEHELLADRDLLQRIAVNCGLDAAEVDEVLDSDKYRREVKEDEREAFLHGVHMVPFFVVGEHEIVGALSVDEMKQTLMMEMR